MGQRQFIAYSVSLGGVVKYIGITTKTVKKRWSQHCQKQRTVSLLSKAIRKYGASAFVVEHIASSWDIASLNELEILLVAQHKTFGGGGYNLTTGGNQPIVFLPEVVARMTAHLRNPSQETRKNMSEGAKRRYSTPEGKAAQSASQQARWTPEARAKQAERARLQFEKPGARELRSQISRAIHSTPEAKARNGQQVRDRLASPEARAAHGKRARAALSTPEAKAKMSASQRRRYYAYPELAKKLHAAHKAYFDNRRSTAASARIRPDH